MATADEIGELIAPACSRFGLDVFDIELSRGRLRVVVEREGSSPSLDELARLSKVLSETLDAAEASGAQLVPGGGYELEVTSPGLERRLRRPEHFARALGATVALRTLPGVPGDRRVAGLLIAVDADGITIEASPLGQSAPSGARKGSARRRAGHASGDAGTGEEPLAEDEPPPRRLTYEQIERAHTVYDWRAALERSAQHDGRAGVRAGRSTVLSPQAARERATNR